MTTPVEVSCAGSPLRRTSAVPSIRRVYVVVVVAVGLAQAASLVAFTLLLASIADRADDETLGIAHDAAWRSTLVKLGLLAGVAALYGCLRGWEFSIAENTGYDVV